MLLVLDAVIFAEVRDRLFDDRVRPRLLYTAVNARIVGKVAEGIGQFFQLLEPLLDARQAHRL